MINRKLLKTNRWFDEEFLQARMTNACFNGGGGGDGGGDDEGFFGEDDDVSGGYEFGDDQRDDMSREIEAQMAAQEAARQAAAAQAQENARIAAASQRQAAQAAAAAAQARQQQAAQQAANQHEQEMARQAQAQAAQQDAAARQAAQRSAAAVMDEQARMGAGAYRAPNTSQDFQNQQEVVDILGSQAGLDAATRAAGGFLDTTRSPGLTGGGMMDYSDMTGLTQDDLSGQWGIGEGSRPAGYDYSGDMNLAMAHGYDQRFSGQPNHAWNQLNEQQKRNVVTREQQGPSKIANFFNLGLDSRLTNLANSELGMGTGPGSPGWDRDDSATEWRDARNNTGGGGINPVITPGGGGGGGGGGGFPPGGGGGFPPWTGGGGFPPWMGGGGYPPMYPGMGGGGMWGGGFGRTGGGMPGYMPNYPIHSQNLFNFTPARAMPGVDPSYQPWMQPAQGMDHNLWNYQAPNLIPWDMSNRVPWNFATTPTGQYGPMVATVGGQPAERGEGA